MSDSDPHKYRHGYAANYYTDPKRHRYAHHYTNGHVLPFAYPQSDTQPNIHTNQYGHLSNEHSDRNPNDDTYS
jgi:hypothetical protein